MAMGVQVNIIKLLGEDAQYNGLLTNVDLDTIVSELHSLNATIGKLVFPRLGEEVEEITRWASSQIEFLNNTNVLIIDALGLSIDQIEELGMILSDYPLVGLMLVPVNRSIPDKISENLRKWSCTKNEPVASKMFLDVLRKLVRNKSFVFEPKQRYDSLMFKFFSNEPYNVEDDLTLSISFPEGTSDEEVKRKVAQLAVELDNAHREAGGNGLKLDGLKATEVKVGENVLM